MEEWTNGGRARKFKSYLNKFKKIELVACILPNQNSMKLEINHTKKEAIGDV